MDQLGSQSQTDFVEQQNLTRELLHMGSQLQSPTENPIDEAANAGGGATQGADGPMQTDDDDQATRIPAASARPARVQYRAAAVPRMVELGTAVLSALLAGSLGKWLRRYVRDHRITQKARAAIVRFRRSVFRLVGHRCGRTVVRSVCRSVVVTAAPAGHTPPVTGYAYLSSGPWQNLCHGAFQRRRASRVQVLSCFLEYLRLLLGLRARILDRQVAPALALGHNRRTAALSGEASRHSTESMSRGPLAISIVVDTAACQHEKH